MLGALGPAFVVLVAVTAVFVNFSLHKIEEGKHCDCRAKLVI